MKTVLEKTMLRHTNSPDQSHSVIHINCIIDVTVKWNGWSKKKKQFMHDLIIVNHTLSKSTTDNGCVFSEVREDIPISSII